MSAVPGPGARDASGRGDRSAAGRGAGWSSRGPAHVGSRSRPRPVRSCLWFARPQAESVTIKTGPGDPLGPCLPFLHRSAPSLLGLVAYWLTVESVGLSGQESSRGAVGLQGRGAALQGCGAGLQDRASGLRCGLWGSGAVVQDCRAAEPGCGASGQGSEAVVQAVLRGWQGCHAKVRGCGAAGQGRGVAVRDPWLCRHRQGGGASVLGYIGGRRTPTWPAWGPPEVCGGRPDITPWCRTETSMCPT